MKPLYPPPDNIRKASSKDTITAMQNGGIRLAFGTDVNAELPNKFSMRPLVSPSMPENPRDSSKIESMSTHVCPRCKQPNTAARIANNSEVHYCTRGCRYVVPLPTTRLI